MLNNPVIPFLIALFVLVVIHELGHFIMAKLGGIRVTQFSVGFGKKLFGFTYKGTEYKWSLLPLGGYVDFMGETVYTNEIPDDVKHFYNRPKIIRFLVLVMGPLFNLILAFLLFWFIRGAEPYYEPVYQAPPFTIGYINPDSPEKEAGLMEGDRILTVNGDPVTDYETFQTDLLLSPGKELNLEVQRGEQMLDISFTVATDPIEGNGMLHMEGARRAMVGRVMEDSAAERAGLQPFDIITHIDDKELPPGQSPPADIIKSSEGRELKITVLREGEPVDLFATAELNEDNVWLLGFNFGGELRKVDLSAGQAFGKAWEECVKNSTLIYKALKKLVIGEMSVKTLSGPIGVARAADTFWKRGMWDYLFLLAVLSLNLGIINLLPIPFLDGGEIFVLLTEWIGRRDFSLATKMKVKMVGLVFLVGLMAVVMVSDVIKVVQSFQQ